METSSFLKKLLPVKECLIEGIFYRVKAQGYYVDGRWKGYEDLSPDTDSLDQEDIFPEADSVDEEDEIPAAKHENPVLAAFVDVANVICKAAEEKTKDEGDSHLDRLGANKWVDYHSGPPISKDKDNIGPSALLVLTEYNDWMKQVRRSTLFFGIDFILNIDHERPQLKKATLNNGATFSHHCEPTTS